jgi:hypothetical protein
MLYLLRRKGAKVMASGLRGKGFAIDPGHCYMFIYLNFKIFK